MSFIQFESAREKEKIRQELREARESMLEKAKKNAEQRAQKRANEVLSGEQQWMLPTVAAKIKKMSKLDKVTKASKKKDKKKKSKSKTKSKKSKKKSSKKKSKRYSSSSSGSSSDSDDSSEEERISRKKKKHISSDSDTDTSESASDGHAECSAKNEEPLQRDSWMTDTLLLPTFSRTRVEKKVNEKQQIDAYDPAKSTRELNPYWKITGTGMPSFQKPKDDSDEDHEYGSSKSSHSNPFSTNSTRGWCKRSTTSTDTQREMPPKRSSPPRPSTRSESVENTNQREKQPTRSSSPNASSLSERQSSEFLTDQQMNELGAKIVKAEIMGNMDLAEKLKQKLEESRANRNKIKTTHTESFTKQIRKPGSEDVEDILLTRTDNKGNCRPLAQSYGSTDPRDLYGPRSSRKKQHKRVETHDNNERVRYFPDDDKYDIKQMFEREKYTSSGDNNLEFANIVSKSKSRNDDMDDIFADKIRYEKSNDAESRKELNSAISEQRSLAKQLDNCDKCFDSGKMDKKMLVAMGDKSYLALPWHVGLQVGHCIIAPLQHVSCCTQLDEDTWEEMSNYRKALTRMFNAQHKDVIFFEIANKLQRHPHLTIHCIPIPEREGEMAPFYFKKAIEESEHEWSVNKQLISLRNKSLRNSIPRGLDYFWVHFGMDTGFAHVIEDHNRFPSNFALEIIGGMLHLDANTWRRPKKEQNIITKVKLFADMWKKFDFTT